MKKKIAVLLAVLAALALIFVAGCDSSGSSSLAGSTWRVTDDDATVTLYFASGGTFTMTSGVSGTWSLSGTTLTLTPLKGVVGGIPITTTYNGGNTMIIQGREFTRVS